MQVMIVIYPHDSSVTTHIRHRRFTGEQCGIDRQAVRFTLRETENYETETCDKFGYIRFVSVVFPYIAILT